MIFASFGGDSGSEQDTDLTARGLDTVVDQHPAPADEPRHVLVIVRQELVLVHADIAVHRAPAHAGHVEDATAEQVVGPLPHTHIGDLAARARARALRVRVLALQPTDAAGEGRHRVVHEVQGRGRVVAEVFRTRDQVPRRLGVEQGQPLVEPPLVEQGGFVVEELGDRRDEPASRTRTYSSPRLARPMTVDVSPLGIMELPPAQPPVPGGWLLDVVGFCMRLLNSMVALGCRELMDPPSRSCVH